MQQCLTLTTPATEVARRAMFFQLTNVPPHRAPSSNLP
jgi:hypothetical protein